MTISASAPPLRRFCGWTVLTAAILALPTRHPYAAVDDPCSDVKVFTERMARTLSAAMSGVPPDGVFRVTGSNSGARFDIQFLSNGQLRGNVAVQRGSEFWQDGAASLNVVGDNAQLLVSWHTGGSGCCRCEYVVARSGFGFSATPVTQVSRDHWQYSESLSVRLSVRARFLTSSRPFTVRFVVFGQDRGEWTALRSGVADAELVVRFPEDFPGWSGAPGPYVWTAVVGREVVTRGAFIFQRDPAEAFTIVRK